MITARSDFLILLKETLDYRNCILVCWDYWDKYWNALGSCRMGAGISGPRHTHTHREKKRVANVIWVKMLFMIVYIVTFGYTGISLNFRSFSCVSLLLFLE